MSDIDLSRFEDLGGHRIPLSVLDGRILDIGGGGEGTISRVCDDVLVIDLSREEIDEARVTDAAVMDASALAFADGSFDRVTAFFSLMYMPPDVIERTMHEVARVLRDGGTAHVWDPLLESPTDREGMIIWPTIEFPDGTTLDTGYGARMRRMSPDDVVRFADGSGLRVLDVERHDAWYRMNLVKD